MGFLKRFLTIVALCLSISIAVSAHSVQLSYTKSTSDTGATGSGYIVYRKSGTCPASVTTTAGFTALNSTLLTGTTYTDSTVIPGSYCYVVVFQNTSASSAPSNTAPAVVLPAAPTNVTVGT